MPAAATRSSRSSSRSTTPTTTSDGDPTRPTTTRSADGRHAHGALQPPRGAAPQGLRPLHATPSSTRPAGSWPTCGWPAPARRSRRRRRARAATRGRPRPAPHRPRRRCATGGEAVRPSPPRPGERPRRLVLLCDVSAARWSPTPGRCCASPTPRWSGRAEVEAFALGTRLTRLTRELPSRDPDAALARAAGRVDDWSGGTRLGTACGAFNDEWGRAGHGPGRDRGDPVRRLGPGRPRRAGRADGPAAPGRPPGRVGQPAQGVARATSRWPGAWPRRCPTSTSSSKATRWPRSRSWPRSMAA